MSDNPIAILTSLQRNWRTHNRRLWATPIHPLPKLQRNRPAARTLLRSRKGNQLHHRLRNRRVLPPPRVLHPQRRTAHLPYPIQAPTAQRARAAVPRVRRDDAGRRARQPEHAVHAAGSRASGHAAAQSFARRAQLESADPRCGSQTQSRHDRCGHGV